MAHAKRSEFSASPAQNRLTPSIGLPVTICVLLYGDHYPLCERFFKSLLSNTPARSFHLRIGLNAVCSQTECYVRRLVQTRENVRAFDSPTNIFKLPMMRRLLYEEEIETRWTFWFDDDSFVIRSDWLLNLALAIESNPGVAMWGSRRIMMPDPPLIDFIRSASWYRGKPLRSHATTGAEFVDFIVGGYWAIQTEVLLRLDWPDPRLIHFEDDYLLGEALHQHGLQIGHCESGVVINAGTRRAPADTPTAR